MCCTLVLVLVLLDVRDMGMERGRGWMDIWSLWLTGWVIGSSCQCRAQEGNTV